MNMAISLAEKGQGKTNPNPAVGALIVKKGNIVGRVYHKRAGLPHAEVNALKQAGENARGALLYVTLEPCDRFGRTPPCTDAIIRKGIRKVIIAMLDPNPVNHGRGIRKLNRRGIETEVGILEEKSKSINRPYIKLMTRKVPYVTVKLAQSLDGKIATKTGDSKWISAPDSRRYVQEIRSNVDAILVGVNTVLRDDPLLTVRRQRNSRPLLNTKKPVRVIVDSGLRTPSDARVFSAIDRFPLIMATTEKASQAKVSLCREKGADVLTVKSRKGKVDLRDLLKKLGERKIMHILVEGGGNLVASLLEDRLVDRLLFFIAPKIIGGRDAVPSVGGRGVDLVRNALKLKAIRAKMLRKDFFIEAFL